MANAITRLTTFLYGNYAGADGLGNRYYSHKKANHTGRHRRWVLYHGKEDASSIPAIYHAWLHYTIDTFPTKVAPLYAWEKDHQPNLTGTAAAYLPQGHSLVGGKRAPASSDYQPWDPNK